MLSLRPIGQLNLLRVFVQFAAAIIQLLDR
jgi:hypothetical protein